MSALYNQGYQANDIGDPYMIAIQEPNVDVHFSAVEEITEDSVIDSEGQKCKVDTIICATGFDVSYRPRFPIIGQNGVDLREKWKTIPESYLGKSNPFYSLVLERYWLTNLRSRGTGHAQFHYFYWTNMAHYKWICLGASWRGS